MAELSSSNKLTIGQNQTIYGKGRLINGIGILAETYIIAAMRISAHTYKLGQATERLCTIAKPSLTRIEHISTLPFFAGTPDWLVRACIVEAYLYLPVFDSMRQAVFTHDLKQQRQLNIVPFALIASSRLRGGSIAPNINVVFMVLCALLYEVDHYMEDVIGSIAGVEETAVEQIVHGTFEQPSVESTEMDWSKCTSERHTEGVQARVQNLDNVKAILQHVTSWVLNGSKLLSSSKYDQTVFRTESKNFYLGQIASILESSVLATVSQCQPPSTTLSKTYHKWVHTTSAEHVAGLLTFAFFCCLVNPGVDGEDCFRGAEAKHLAHDLSLHLASLCRMENDIGSAKRDRQKHNLNSVDFPEFTVISAKGDDLESKTEQLRRLASYERDCYRKLWKGWVN
ncbi:MAG: hypothetical protein Q9213_004885 [Squamulea squamosa]